MEKVTEVFIVIILTDVTHSSDGLQVSIWTRKGYRSVTEGVAVLMSRNPDRCLPQLWWLASIHLDWKGLLKRY